MKYSEILKDKSMSNEQVTKFIELLDMYAADDNKLKLEVALLINNNHYCEFTADHNIEEMKAVAYIGTEGTIIAADSMKDYLNRLGITPDYAYSMIYDAYERAKAKAAELGFSAPSLDINRWDAYRAFAMVLSDYWYTVNGCLEKAAMIAYEYLSDPDRPMDRPR